MRIFIFLLATCFTLAAQISYAQAGFLDLSFDADGMVLIPKLGINDYGKSVAVAPDGKIVIGGFANYGNPGTDTDFEVARLNPDGSLDASFNGGIFSTQFDTLVSWGRAVKVQPDGKIVLTGEVHNIHQTLNFGVARYTNEGLLDPTFGNGGLVHTDVLGNHLDNPRDLVILPSGNIVVGGLTNQGANVFNFALVCYLPNGTLDPNFGTGGIAVLGNVPEASEITHMTALPNGDFMVGGHAIANGISSFAVARFHANGSLDPSFSGNGIWSQSYNGSTCVTTAMHVDPHGRALIGGYSATGNPNPVILMRLKVNGTPDSTFATNGTLAFTSPYLRPQGFGFQADGKIILGGQGTNGNPAVSLIRIDEFGVMDMGFGTNGVGSCVFGAGTTAVEHALMQADGKMLIAGTYAGQFCIARFFGGTAATGIAQENTRGLWIQVSPNPLSATMQRAMISFGLPESGPLRVELRDAQGRLLRNCLASDWQIAGNGQIELELPENIAAGIYWVVVQTGDARISRKVVVF